MATDLGITEDHKISLYQQNQCEAGKIFPRMNKQSPLTNTFSQPSQHMFHQKHTHPVLDT